MVDKKKTSTYGEMTTREAGRKGGQATAQAHGREFYQAIGRKGGAAGGKSSKRGKQQIPEETEERETRIERPQQEEKAGD